MIQNINNYDSIFNKYNISYTYLNSIRTIPEEEIIKFVPKHDVWITGNDPITRKVLYEGKKGNLKFLIKWGSGINNIDIKACEDFNIRFEYTPYMFGEEVSDVAIGYLLMLNRKLHEINIKVKNNIWYNLSGESLYGKKVCVVGFGDVGKHIVKKLHSFGANIFVSDPQYQQLNVGSKILDKKNKISFENIYNITISNLNVCMQNADYVIITCNLNESSHNLINKENLLLCKKGVKLINVSRGSIINEKDVCELLKLNHIDSVALDVFEKEPLPENSELRLFSQNIFGSHNAFNTKESVDKTSFIVINKIIRFFNLQMNSNI